MSRARLQEMRTELRSRPGAQERFDEEVTRMQGVLQLERLRSRQGLTQADLAGVLSVSQRRVSAIEHSDNLSLDALKRYVEALGGELEINAVVDGEHIALLS